MTRLTPLGLAMRSGPPIDPVTPAVAILPAVVYPAGHLLVLVADNRGMILGRLPVEVDGMAWKLNTYGQARMAAPWGVDERLIQIGNRVLILHDSGLKPWGGVIEPPRERKQGVVELTAYSGEYLLGLRQTALTRLFTNATAGEMARALLNEANAIDFSGVEVGSIDEGGERYSTEFHAQLLLKVIQESILPLTGVDWSVSAGEENGRIIFRLHIHERRGRTHNHIWLIEGRNITPANLKEQGRLTNAWTVVGGGADWSTRPVGSAEDTIGQHRYGLREASQIANSVTDPATLAALAAGNLEQTRELFPGLTLDTLNLTPAPWAEYDVGDTVWVDLPSYALHGYRRPLRIIAREFIRAQGVVRHTLDRGESDET